MHRLKKSDLLYTEYIYIHTNIYKHIIQPKDYAPQTKGKGTVNSFSTTN